MAKAVDFWERAYRELTTSKASLAPSVFASQRSEPKLFLSLMSRPATVLDYGCGSGRNTLALLEYGFSVAISDLSTSAMQICATNAAASGHAVRQIPVSRQVLSCADKQFDAVVIWSVLDHMPLADAQAVVSDLYRVTAPDALLLASFDAPEEVEEETELLTDGSLEVVSGRGAGLVLRFYTEQEVEMLFEPGWSLISRSGGGDQAQVALFRSKSALSVVRSDAQR